MLSPSYLAGISDDVVRLYSQLETDIISDTARRIAKTGRITATAEWQIKQAQEAGALYETIIEKVAQINNVGKDEIALLFDESTEKSLRFDNKIFIQAGLPEISAPNAQILRAGIENAQGNVANMTVTTAITSQQAFIDASTQAYMQVTSGTFDYNTAISNACTKVARTGARVIEYKSGRTISLEAGIRRNVLTGINQTSQRITDYNCDALGVDLVETSAHSGARPTHAVWQGQIFSRSGRHPKYDDFVSSTGYGEVDGLGGANCRHSFFPFFEDYSERGYTQRELQALENETVTYDGNKIPLYEAEQRLRTIERTTRAWKREAVAQESGGQDASFQNGKVREWQARARSFTSQTGITRDYAREKIY